MQFIGVVTQVILKATGLRVGFIIVPSVCHTVSLVELMKQDKASFSFFNIIIYPDFIFRHKLINIIMTSRCKINIKNTPYQSSVDNPDGKTALEFFPQTDMHVFALGKILSVMSYLTEVAAPASLFAFLEIAFLKCFVIGCALFH